MQKLYLRSPWCALIYHREKEILNGLKVLLYIKDFVHLLKQEYEITVKE